MPDDIDNATYISFTSYKRNGDPVALPVWVVPFEGGYAFTTEAEAYKVKRVLRNPRITVAVSDVRGRVRDGATVHEGVAEVLTGDDARRVQRAISSKYRVGSALIGVLGALRRVVSRGRRDAADAAIKFTLDR